LATISGSIPHPYNRPSGCLFHPRCPQFMLGTCDAAEPPLVELTGGQAVSCFLYGPSAVSRQQSADGRTLKADG
jgi:oligopeptide/dipeptide ABC transporter ATP-binding protein